MKQPQLGWTPATRRFALLAPKATGVELLQRRHPDDPDERISPCTPHASAWGRVFVCEGHDPAAFRYYRFAVLQDGVRRELSDPWGLAQARQIRLGTPTWSVAQALPQRVHRPRPNLPMAEQVVLEVHVRDATCLWESPPQGVRPGSYAALVHPQSPLLAYARSLAVTALELLPTATFPIREPSPQEPDGLGQQWNPTGVNHWGYMPSHLLAVSERYLHEFVDDSRHWQGVRDDGSFADPALELRAAVDAAHAAGLAVVADVVWNHVSIADVQPLLVLDPGDWFHREPGGQLRNRSGCGNDLNTAHPAIRALVVAAARRWLVDLGMDGLRLDLADLIDNRTLADVSALAHAVHPSPLLFAEPWSFGGYRPAEIARLGYAVWNDRFRNGWKGHHPLHGRGLALGEEGGGASVLDGLALLRGWPVDPPAAHLKASARGEVAPLALQVHYLESHDDHTAGDFVRLALGLTHPVASWRELYPLQPRELQAHKLLAAALCLSAGPLLLAAGQTWARPRLGAQGHLVGNAWNRDDAASHLDWHAISAAPELHGWWVALLQLRRHWLLPGLGQGRSWLARTSTASGGVGWVQRTARGDLAAAINLHTQEARWWDLPGGPWHILLQSDATVDVIPTQHGVALRLPPGGVAVCLCQPGGDAAASGA